METITTLAKSAVNAGRWCVNAALMAVGVAPIETPIIDSAVIATGDDSSLRHWRSDALDEFQPLVNPATGLPMLNDAVDVGGHAYGTD